MIDSIAAMIQDVVGMLVGQDFGVWARGDVERIAGAAGWSVQEGEYGLVIETGGPVRVRATRIGYGQERFGFGELIDLQVTESCAAEELAELHAATLAAVVAVLGPPALVGGPDAWAFWRDPRVRLERDLRRSSVTLRVEPAEPAEEEENRNAEYHPDWQYPLWTAEPDVHSAAAASLVGMMFYDARPAETWEEFETSLRGLFVSLASDMPALIDYISHVGWEIAEVDGDHMVAGWFNEDGANINSAIYNTTESTDYPRVPLDPAGGERVAQIAIDTIRSWGRDSPAALFHQNWTSAEVRFSAKSGFRIS